MYSLQYYIDSWIEVSSQPSTSSLSSAATNDDIITTGLRVEPGEAGMYQHRSRRRRLQHLAAVTTAQVDYSSREASLASSSQEEYEESESEPDPSMSSSNEEMHHPALPASSSQASSHPGPTSSEDEDDEEESGNRNAPDNAPKGPKGMDSAFGSRKRTYDDEPKGYSKKTGKPLSKYHVDASILDEWRVRHDQTGTPWLTYMPATLQPGTRLVITSARRR